MLAMLQRQHKKLWGIYQNNCIENNVTDWDVKLYVIIILEHANRVKSVKNVNQSHVIVKSVNPVNKRHVIVQSVNKSHVIVQSAIKSLVIVQSVKP